MDTAKYRQLLVDLTGYVAGCDAQSARVTARWLRSFDEILSAPPARAALLQHLARVGRSLSAITILSKERASQLALPGAAALETIAADLTRELTRLQNELRRVDQLLEDRGLQSIVGEVLNSVEFEMDYVQLRFNEASLTTFTCPHVRNSNQLLQFNDLGYRDMLCGFIGETVLGIEMKEDEFIRIAFAGGQDITVSLKPEDAVGPEHAYFTSATGLSISW